MPQQTMSYVDTLVFYNICMFQFATLSECCHFHIILYQLCPGYLKDWFVFTETYAEHSGWNKFRLFVPRSD